MVDVLIKFWNELKVVLGLFMDFWLIWFITWLAISTNRDVYAQHSSDSLSVSVFLITVIGCTPIICTRVCSLYVKLKQ